MRFYTANASAIDLQAEKKYFGIDHEKLGEILAKKWNFPESISTTIAYHHSPLEALKHQVLVAAVNIANMLAHALAIGKSGNYYVSAFYPETWRVLELSMDELETVLKRSLNEIDKSRSMLSELS
jgi:HD-like signal output (HDOD) protein